MSNRVQRRWFIPAMLMVVSAAHAAEDLAALDKLKQPLDRATLSTHTFDSLGFRIEASDNRQLDAKLDPNGAAFQSLVVRAEGTFKVAFDQGPASALGGGVALFHRASGAPMLSVSDPDGDGRLDNLTYTTMSADGRPLVSVTDYEADGQADLRVNFPERRAEIWHRDRWYQVDRRGERRGIMLDGKFVELRQQNNRLIVP